MFCTTINEQFTFYTQATGGNKVYEWSVSNEDIATVDSAEGIVTVHNGPGEIMVRAAMPDSPHNYDEIKVCPINPHSIE